MHDNFESANSLFNYSVGIHPWYINENTISNDFEKMKLASNKINVLAIGECGLDRICKTSFELQKAVFIRHIQWANEIAKPIIIHCVKAHEDILELLQEYQCLVPVIFHGFNNKESTANKIIKAGYFLSFGNAILSPSNELVFNHIPRDKIFLETDDSDHTIEAIYEQAGRIKNISLEQLNLQIKKNTKKVFNLNVL
jgi:TatD DNase family protein